MEVLTWWASFLGRSTTSSLPSPSTLSFVPGSLIPVPILQLGALISLEVPPAAGT
jgi:hypothetical protein